MKIWSFFKRLPLNFFDISIIIVAIIIVVIFILFNVKPETSDTENNTSGIVEYRVEITEISDKTSDMINIGDHLIDKVKKYNLGTVKDVEIYPSVRSAVDYSTNTLLYSETPGEFSAGITIVADCTQTESAIVVDGAFEVRVGTAMHIIGPGYAGTGFIIDVDRV